ncbi:hypothetical protein JTB14_014051 [Gonioctena quinquepunctata]|nr:hypothetical protein JTB14_014051 [Gonioctena quinquepunctata]
MENKKLLEYKVNNLLNEIKKYTSAENTNAYKNSMQAKTTVSKERTSTTKKDQQNIKANRDSSENKQINNDESQEIPDYPSHNENMNTDDFEKVQKESRNETKDHHQTKLLDKEKKLIHMVSKELYPKHGCTYTGCCPKSKQIT